METADAIIVGAGVNGTSAAFHLAKAGMKNIVVVERAFLGAGAIGKNSTSVVFRLPCI